MKSDSQDVIVGTRTEGSAAVLQLSGEIDMKTSALVKTKLKELFSAKPKVLVVDLSAVTFMDSSGLATMVGALKQCRVSGSRLKLAGLTQDVRNIFEICRLEKIFDIYDSPAAALAQ